MLARLYGLTAGLLTLLFMPLVVIAARDTPSEPYRPPIYRSPYPVITPENVGRLTPIAVLTHSDNQGYNWYHAYYRPGWSPDGRYLAAMDTGAEGETRPRGVWLFDAANLDNPPRLFEHSGILVGYSFSPDSVWLATITHPGYQGGKMIVWDVESGEQVFEFEGLSEVQFSPDRTRMASDIGTLSMWETETLQEIVRLRDGCSFNFDPAMTIVAVVDCNNRPSVVSLYDLVSGQRVFVGAHEEAIYALDTSPDQRFVVTSDSRGTIKIWGLSSNTQDNILFSGEDYLNDAPHVRFSPDSSVLASWTSGGNIINLWSVETGSHIAALGGHSPPGYDWQGGVDLQVVYAPHSQLLAATWQDGVTEDKNSRLWDTRTGNLLLTLPEELDATFSPDGTMLATDSTDGSIKIWAVQP